MTFLSLFKSKKVQSYLVAFIMAFPFLGCRSVSKNSTAEPYFYSLQRAKDLVGQMTLEEKVSQMTSNASAIERLGIPAYDWQNECLHGVGKLAEYKVTVYPQPIGLAASWDVKSIKEMADYIAEEGRAINNDANSKKIAASYYGLTYWSPNINIFRDPRWGRGHETFGEGPYLTGRLGKAFVAGLQGDNPRYLKASACAKHFAVHSGPETLRHKFNAEVSEYDLWDTYLPAFRDLIIDAKVTGVMCAYNAYAGQPCCGNDLLMMDILRNKWDFQGYVTSDCGAIDDFYKYHYAHQDTLSAAVDAVIHGTDLDCIRDAVFKSLVKAVQENLIDEAEIDKSVTRLFDIRYKLGMFDEDNPYNKIGLEALNKPEHAQLALRLARESIVLLKNDNNVLPLRKDIRKIAVVGPNANSDLAMLGNYNGYPHRIVSVLDGIADKISENTEIVYHKMINIIDADNFKPLNIDSLCKYENKSGFQVNYFYNLTFEGFPIIDYVKKPELSYRGKTEICDSINSSAFTVRYLTQFVPKESGFYTFNMDTDKRFCYWINDSLMIDAFNRKGKAAGISTIYCEANQIYDIRIDAIMKGHHGNLKFEIGKIEDKTLDAMCNQISDADAIVFVGGISPSLEGEQNGVKTPGFEDGDRTTIKLPDIQTKLMQELKKTGKPLVFVMLTGSALAIPWEKENVDAIVNCWYGGQSGGEAVADVLFGEYNPSGRLPVTFYASDDDLPEFTNYSMDNRTYRYFKDNPLYPFGYGMSYTQFSYSNLNAPDKVESGCSLPIDVDVTNTGDCDGEEVVQLYVSHACGDSGMKTPIRALKGFERVALKKGETKTVRFELSPRDLAIYDITGEIFIKPGELNLSIGGGQPNGTSPFVSKNICISGEKKYLLR